MAAAHLPQLTTQAMRAMLGGDRRAAQRSQDALDDAVRSLAASGEKAAARYVFVLHEMVSSHKLVDLADTLEVCTQRYTSHCRALHRKSTRRPCTVCGPCSRTAGGTWLEKARSKTPNSRHWQHKQT